MCYGICKWFANLAKKLLVKNQEQCRIIPSSTNAFNGLSNRRKINTVIFQKLRGKCFRLVRVYQTQMNLLIGEVSSYQTDKYDE